jgi:hypothetical protein
LLSTTFTLGNICRCGIVLEIRIFESWWVKKRVSLSFSPVSTIDQVQQPKATSEKRHKTEVAKIEGLSFLIVYQIGMKA